MPPLNSKIKVGPAPSDTDGGNDLSKKDCKKKYNAAAEQFL